MVGIDPERVSTAGQRLRQNVAVLDDIEIDIRIALTRSGLTSPVLATVDDIEYELSSLDQVLQTRTNLALGFQLALGPARLAEQTSQLWNHLLDPRNQGADGTSQALRFQTQEDNPDAEHNTNNPDQFWDSAGTNGGTPNEASTDFRALAVSTATGAATGAAIAAPGFYVDKYDELIYAKGNGNLAWKNRVDGPDGRQITSTQRALRTAAYGDTVEEGASRVRIASFGKVLSLASTAWDAKGNYEENNVEGRNEAIVLLDTAAETLVKAGAGAAGSSIGCNIGGSIGGMVGPITAGVGCFAGGLAGSAIATDAADRLYDSVTERDSGQDEDHD